MTPYACARFSKYLDEALETLKAQSLKDEAVIPQGNATVPLPLMQ